MPAGPAPATRISEEFVSAIASVLACAGIRRRENSNLYMGFGRRHATRHVIAPFYPASTFQRFVLFSRAERTIDGHY
jgi:hypothetical protein